MKKKLLVTFLFLLFFFDCLISFAIHPPALGAMVFTSVIACAIITHQLLDIRIFPRKNVVDYQKTLGNFSEELTSIIELEPLFDAMVGKVTEAMHVERGCVLFRGPERELFTAKSVRGMDPSMGEFALKSDHPAIPFLERKRAIVSITAMRGEEADIFRGWHMALLVPLISKRRLLAVFCLGGKRSGDAYTGEDLRFLSTIANQAAVAVENAQLLLSVRALEKNLLQTDKLAALGTLAASVAHEIKNPLSSVKTFCQLVERRLSDGVFIEKFNAIVPREIERMEQVLGQLLHFSKRSDLDFQRTKVEHMIEGLLVLLQYETFKNNVKVVRRYDETTSPVLAAVEQLKQVFMNLVLNAIQAMPQGGTLSVKTEKALDKGGENIIISFTDTGNGIPAAHRDKLFKPFFSTKEQGTGLGLSIAQRIIREHNGTIGVESIEGQGTTFIIRLPVNPEVHKN